MKIKIKNRSQKYDIKDVGLDMDTNIVNIRHKRPNSRHGHKYST